LLIYQGGQWLKPGTANCWTINFHGRRLNVEQLDRQGSGFVARHNPDAFFFGPVVPRHRLNRRTGWWRFVSDWSDAGECHDQDGIHRTSGRIYKLTYGEAKKATTADLTAFTDVELAKLQTSANDWQARQGRRVLADRAHRGMPLKEGRELLQRLAASDANEVNRLRALWTLQVSGGIETALRAQVLRHGIRTRLGDPAHGGRVACQPGGRGIVHALRQSDLPHGGGGNFRAGSRP
jgi:hypothetical protein